MQLIDPCATDAAVVAIGVRLQRPLITVARRCSLPLSIVEALAARRQTYRPVAFDRGMLDRVMLQTRLCVLPPRIS